MSTTKTARQEGYDANLDGILARDNPYPIGPLHSAWCDGHSAAQRELRDALEHDTYNRAVMFGD